MKIGIEVIVEVEVAAPRAAVWAFVSDSERIPEWFEEIESVEQESDGPPGLGTVVRYTVDPGHRSGTMATVEWEPGSKLEWDGPPLTWAGGGARPRGSFELSDAGEGRTHFRGTFRPELSGTQILLAPYLKRWLGRHRRAGAAKMKALVEEGAGS
jgi:uncharacterized protein YndB with AHSA1/START domain